MKYYMWVLHPTANAYVKMSSSFDSKEAAKSEMRELRIKGLDVELLPENESPPDVYVNPRKGRR